MMITPRLARVFGVLCALALVPACGGSRSGGTGTAPVDANVLLSFNRIAAFSTGNPAALEAPVDVLGMTVGDTLVAIDRRPQNGFLYGLGYNPAGGTVTLYALSSVTGQATALSAPASFDVPVTGTSFGMDFNPTVDRVRVVTDSGQNFRMNPTSGALVDGDVILGGLQMDGAINGATVTADATSYTNNQMNATVTTLYTLSAGTNTLYIQNPPNVGTLTNAVTVTEGGATVNFTGANGFDIPPGVNVLTSNTAAAGFGYAILNLGVREFFARIDLTTGAISGKTATGTSGILGLALQMPASAPMIALSADGTQLIRFQSATPGTPTTVGISSVTAGDVLVGIDYRPQTGQLMGFGVNDAANTGTLYLLDPQGVATAIGTPGQVAFVASDGVTVVDLPASGYGFDINPTVDRVRVVTDTGLNFRINPNNGAPVDGMGFAGTNTDTGINGLQPGSTGVSGTAYTNSFGQPLAGGVTTVYTIDSAADGLYIQNPPNNGTQTNFLPITLNGAPLNFTAVNGFDIPGSVRVVASNTPVTSGSAFAALTVGGNTGLYSINLASGAATLLGTLPATAGLAVGETTVK